MHSLRGQPGGVAPAALLTTAQLSAARTHGGEGCGGSGTGAGAQAIQADPEVRLVAMADVFGDHLQSSFKGLSAKFGASGQMKVTEGSMFVGFDAYKKAIDLADVVILTTPPGFRPLHFEYAVQQDKHIFMEKPVATDVVGIKKVLAAGKLAKSKKLKHKSNMLLA